MAETPPPIRGDRVTDEGPETIFVLLLAFLFPGTGHALIGQFRKGIAFFLIVGFMFTTGLLLDGRLYDIDPARPLSILATIASHGSGAFDLAARFAGWSGDAYSRTHEYGSAFILTAGVMNLLLLFDVWDELSADSGKDPSDPEPDDEASP